MELLKEVYQELCQYLSILWRRKWVCLVVGACPWLVALIVCLFSPNLYKAKALLALAPVSLESQFLFPTQQWGRLQYVGNSTPMHTWKEIMKSEACVVPVLEELSWADRKGEPVSPDDFVDAWLPKMLKYGGGLRVRFDAKAEVFEVTGYSLDLEQSARLANGLCSSFLRFMSERNKSEAAEVVSVLEIEIPALDARIRELDREAQDFRIKHGFLEFRNEIQRLSSLKETWIQERDVLDRSMEETRVSLEELRLKIQEVPEFHEALVNLERNPQLDTYSNEMMRVENLLISLMSRAHDNHPDVIAARAQLENLREGLRALLEETFRGRQTQRSELYDGLVSRLCSTEVMVVTQDARRRILNQQINDLSLESQRFMALQGEWDELQRKRDALVVRYGRLIETMENASLASKLDVTNAFQVQEARTDLGKSKKYKVFPKIISMIVMTGTFSLLFGFSAGLIVDLVDPRIIQPDRVSDLLNGQDVYPTGISPRWDEGWKADSSAGLQGLLWNLEKVFSEPKGLHGVLGVLSPSPSINRSIFCKKLSLALREAGQTVTWLDLSHGMVEGPPKQYADLHNLLQGRQSPCYEPVDGIRWIGCADAPLPYHPVSEFMGVIQDFKERSTTVLLGLPPALPGSITLALAEHLEASIMVVDPHWSLVSHLRANLKALQVADKPVLIASMNA